jgi:hypothetical protein
MTLMCQSSFNNIFSAHREEEEGEGEEEEGQSRNRTTGKEQLRS